MAHAKMTITIEKHLEVGGIPTTTIEVEGCGVCIAAALTIGMLTNDKVKKIIQVAVKAANEQRAKNQN